MNNKIKNDVKQNLKLTTEEIKKVNGFADLSDEETNTLADFIYNISIILYNTNENGKS